VPVHVRASYEPAAQLRLDLGGGCTRTVPAFGNLWHQVEADRATVLLFQSMSAVPSLEPLYAAARRIIDAGLAADDSAFTPGTAIWTVQAADDLHQRFVLAPDTGVAAFLAGSVGQLLSTRSGGCTSRRIAGPILGAVVMPQPLQQLVWTSQAAAPSQ
jgi:hypothetical protein